MKELYNFKIIFYYCIERKLRGEILGKAKFRENTILPKKNGRLPFFTTYLTIFVNLSETRKTNVTQKLNSLSYF